MRPPPRCIWVMSERVNAIFSSKLCSPPALWKLKLSGQLVANTAYKPENTELVDITAPLLLHLFAELLLSTMNKRSLTAPPAPQPDERPPKRAAAEADHLPSTPCDGHPTEPTCPSTSFVQDTCAPTAPITVSDSSYGDLQVDETRPDSPDTLQFAKALQSQDVSELSQAFSSLIEQSDVQSPHMYVRTTYHHHYPSCSFCYNFSLSLHPQTEQNSVKQNVLPEVQ